MSQQDSGRVLSRLKLLGGEIIASTLFLLALVIIIGASNPGSAVQGWFLWMAIILVVLLIAGVEILVDVRRLSNSDR